MSKLSYLASVSETRSVLEQHGLMTKKALGQHFLINDGIVQHICDLAELSTEDNVVEAQFIMLLKEVGFTLQEIIDYKNFLLNFDNNDDGTNQFLLKKQEQISRQMEELQEKYDKITILRKKFKGKVLTLMKEDK